MEWKTNGQKDQCDVGLQKWDEDSDMVSTKCSQMAQLSGDSGGVQQHGNRREVRASSDKTRDAFLSAFIISG